jgi:hypothetical protein
MTRAYKFKNSKVYSPLKSIETLNSMPNFSKEGFTNTPLISKKDYISVYNETALDSLDESYESFKNFSLNLLAKKQFCCKLKL